jgi:tetratricopeptide (TPR) repeat protein
MDRQSLDFEEFILERLTGLEEQARKNSADVELLLKMAESQAAELSVTHHALLALVEELERRKLLEAGAFKRGWAARLGRGLSAAGLKEHFLRLREQLFAPQERRGREEYLQALRHAEGLLLADETGAAQREFARLHQRHPSPPLAELLGQAALAGEDYPGAARFFTQALPGGEGSSAALGLATAEYLRGRYAGAKATTLLITDPGRRQLLTGLIALATGAPREAATAFATLAESGDEALPGGASSQATWLYFWARALAAAGEAAAAASVLDEALTRDPHHRSALAFRAFLAARTGTAKRAAALYADLLRLDPDGELALVWRRGSRGKFPGAPPPFTGANADDLLILLGLGAARAREIVRESAGAVEPATSRKPAVSRKIKHGGHGGHGEEKMKSK